MKRSLFILLFSFFASVSFGQDKPHTVKSGDTITDYYANGCVWAKGVWKAYKNGCSYGYVGKYIWYYETKCGQLKREIMHDENGVVLYDREFDENGNMTKNNVPKMANVKKDSCRYSIGDYFCPDCIHDTAMEAWFLNPAKYNNCDCRIDSMYVEVRDTSGKTTIYADNEMWSGMERRSVDNPYAGCYYPSGFYPYTIKIYSHNGELYRKEGKVSLVIESSAHICK